MRWVTGLYYLDVEYDNNGGFKALDNDRAGMLQTQLEALSNTEHAVQKLMSKC